MPESQRMAYLMGRQQRLAQQKQLLLRLRSGIGRKRQEKTVVMTVVPTTATGHRRQLKLGPTRRVRN